MDKWKSASNYMGEDYSQYYVLLTKSRDSDVLTKSNFDTALEQLGGENKDSGVEVIRSGHWAVGWIEMILIHETATDKIKVGEQIEASLKDYPILDEDKYYRMTMEHAQEVWDVLPTKERRELLKRYNDNPRKAYNKLYPKDNAELEEYLAE